VNKILVTGACGNAGQRIWLDLVNSGYEVRLADMANPPHDDERLRDFMKCDTRTQSDLRRALFGCDSVVHLAAWHSAHKPLVSDSTVFSINVEGTFNLLEACKEAGILSFVFASSMA
jgi:nucleoside-diphosphate-sugar epimerase